MNIPKIDFFRVIVDLEAMGCGIRRIAKLLGEDKSKISRVKNGQDPGFWLGCKLLTLRARKKRTLIRIEA